MSPSGEEYPARSSLGVGYQNGKSAGETHLEMSVLDIMVDALAPSKFNIPLPRESDTLLGDGKTNVD